MSAFLLALNASMRRLNAACLVATICVGSYYAFFEPPYLTYENLPFPVLTPVVHDGEPVLLMVGRCNNDDKTRIYGISHRLVGEHLTILLSAVPTSIEPGCTTAISAVNVIPKGVPPGTYHIEGYAEVQGTLRTSSVSWRSATFQVVR